MTPPIKPEPENWLLRRLTDTLKPALPGLPDPAAQDRTAQRTRVPAMPSVPVLKPARQWTPTERRVIEKAQRHDQMQSRMDVAHEIAGAGAQALNPVFDAARELWNGNYGFAALAAVPLVGAARKLKLAKGTLGKLAEQAKSGGFTYNPTTGKFTPPGAKGYAVAGDLGAPPAVFDHIPSADEIADYVRANADAFSGDVNIGGWWDADAGRFFLEPSEVVGGKDDAMWRAFSRNEKAIYDFETGQSIPNPYYHVPFKPGTEYAPGTLVKAKGDAEIYRVGDDGAFELIDPPAAPAAAFDPDERIATATMRYVDPDGTVHEFHGAIHPEADQKAARAGIRRWNRETDSAREVIDGFTTTKGRFLPRGVEADEIARRAGQMKDPARGIRAENLRMAPADEPAEHLVPAAELEPLREYSTRANPELLDSIRREGIRNPIRLEYDAETGRMVVADGAHRLDAARRLGMTDVSVTFAPGGVSDMVGQPAPQGLLARFLGNERAAGVTEPTTVQADLIERLQQGGAQLDLPPVRPAAAGQVFDPAAVSAFPDHIRAPWEEAPRWEAARADLSVTEPVIRRAHSVFRENAERGLRENPESVGWYDLGQMRRAFEEQSPTGAEDFRMFTQFMGPTSAGSTVPINTKLAGYMYHLWKQNPEKFAQDLRNGTLELETGFKHRNQTSVNRGLLRILEEGSQSPYDQPKTFRFSGLLNGDFWNSVPLDMHLGRQVGLRGMLADKSGKYVVPGRGYPEASYARTGQIGTSPIKTHYGSVEKAIVDDANKLGLPAGPYMAAGWVGGGAQTNVADPRNMVEIMNERLEVTGRQFGISPNEALKKFIRGEIPLYMLGGVALGGGLLTQDEGQ